jgi:hypothetical protein
VRQYNGQQEKDSSIVNMMQLMPDLATEASYWLCYKKCPWCQWNGVSYFLSTKLENKIEECYFYFLCLPILI